MAVWSIHDSNLIDQGSNYPMGEIIALKYSLTWKIALNEEARHHSLQQLPTADQTCTISHVWQIDLLGGCHPDMGPGENGHTQREPRPGCPSDCPPLREGPFHGDWASSQGYTYGDTRDDGHAQDPLHWVPREVYFPMQPSHRAYMHLYPRLQTYYRPRCLQPPMMEPIWTSPPGGPSGGLTAPQLKGRGGMGRGRHLGPSTQDLHGST